MSIFVRTVTQPLEFRSAYNGGYRSLALATQGLRISSHTQKQNFALCQSRIHRQLLDHLNTWAAHVSPITGP